SGIDAGSGDDAAAPVGDAGHDAGLDGSAAGVDASDAGAPQALGVPMYVDPSSSPATWTQMTGGAPAVALLIANPDSGPGSSTQADYTSEIAAVHAAGQILVGYVHTQYAARPISDVEADIDAWYSSYPGIDGVFSDETSSDKSTVSPYYEPLYEYVKKKKGADLVIVNPGTGVDESFMQAADVIVTFEDTYAKYTGASTPSWVTGYPRWRFWNLVLSTSSVSDMQNAVSLARQRNVGYVYVTDQGPGTAYEQIVSGSYWQAEVAAVQAP
ncbi:MAG: spherulation-specific family 4 protein, partial [Polyangiaceae bacterium]